MEKATHLFVTSTDVPFSDPPDEWKAHTFRAMLFASAASDMLRDAQFQANRVQRLLTSGVCRAGSR